MLAGMIQKFKEKNIVCDGLVSFELSKETNEDFAKGIDNYKPDASLMINLQETRVMGYGPMGGRFDLTLTDRRTKQQVWTGSLNVSGHLDSKATINKTIDSIIGKLTEDGIVE